MAMNCERKCSLKEEEEEEESKIKSDRDQQDSTHRLPPPMASVVLAELNRILSLRSLRFRLKSSNDNFHPNSLVLLFLLFLRIIKFRVQIRNFINLEINQYYPG